jgi:hypothetical protein
MDPDSEAIEGMTVNERLSHFGLLDSFDAAVRSRQSVSVVNVLLQARFTEKQAHQTADTILSNPGFYGF